MVPLQDTGRPHDVDVEPCSHPLAPLQLPVLPQGGLAAHCPVGAGVPAASGVQLPGEVPLQVWQVPQAALPQHTPLMQLPLMHWLPAVQAVPLGLRAQLRFGGVPWQVNGDRHCESIEQVLRQVSVPHRYGEQLDEVAPVQLPVPLQCEIGVNVEPVQVCAPHDTVVAASWHPPAPLQNPVLPQGGYAEQRFIGSAVPTGRFAQLPALAPTLHDWQSGQELLTQQTPFKQVRPDRQAFVVGPHA
jgi:hypothetical protein